MRTPLLHANISSIPIIQINRSRGATRRPSFTAVAHPDFCAPIAPLMADRTGSKAPCNRWQPLNGAYRPEPAVRAAGPAFRKPVVLKHGPPPLIAVSRPDPRSIAAVLPYIRCRSLTAITGQPGLADGEYEIPLPRPCQGPDNFTPTVGNWTNYRILSGWSDPPAAVHAPASYSAARQGNPQ